MWPLPHGYQLPFASGANDKMIGSPSAFSAVAHFFRYESNLPEASFPRFCFVGSSTMSISVPEAWFARTSAVGKGVPQPKYLAVIDGKILVFCSKIGRL